MAANLGSLVFALQADMVRTQEDMGKLNQIVENTMNSINAAAMRTSRNVQGIAQAAGGIGRVEGAEEAAKSIDKIGHSSVGAKREMLVLAHEISQGNFKRAMGSVMVLGERMDWMSKIMSPTGAAVGALLAVVGGLAYAFYEASKATEDFNNALKATGNFSTVTERSFRQMANNISDDAHVSVNAATEAGLALIRTGQFQVVALHDTEVAMLNWMKVTGENAEASAKSFAKMREDAVKWAEENNNQYHVVTGAQLEQMESLKKLGDTQGAYQVLLHALFTAQGGDLEHATTLWERFIKVVESAGMIEASAAPAYVVPEVPPAQLDAERESRHLQQVQEVADAKAKDYQTDVFNATQRDIQFQKTFATRKMKRDEETADKLRDDKLLGKSAADTAADIALIDEKYKDKKSGGNIPRADLGAEMKPLQDQITAEDKLLAYREKSLAGYYKRDQISIEGYYTTRQTVIEANAQRISKLYDQEIAAEEKYASSTKGAAHIEALTHANALRDQQEQAATRTSEALAQLTEEKASATDHYREEVEKLTSELDKLNNRQGNSAGADFDRTHQKLSDQATAAGDTGTLDTLAQARSAAVAQGQMNALKHEAQVITEALGTTEKRIALQEQLDQKTELQGTIDTMKARADAAQQLDVIAGKMTAVANDSGMPTLIADAQKFKLQTDQVGASVDILGKSVQDNLATGFATVFDNTINRTKTLKQSFLDFTNSIEQSLLKLISQDLFSQLFSIGGSAGGGASGSGTSFLSQLVGMLGSSSGSAAAGAGVEVGGAMDMAMPVVTAALAGGGPAGAGGMYQVNERGPELLTVANKTFLMMGDQPGKVTPTGDAGNGGSGRNVFNMNIAVPAGTTRSTAQQQAGAIMRQAQIAMARNN